MTLHKRLPGVLVIFQNGKVGGLWPVLLLAYGMPEIQIQKRGYAGSATG